MAICEANRSENRNKDGDPLSRRSCIKLLMSVEDLKPSRMSLWST